MLKKIAYTVLVLLCAIALITTVLFFREDHGEEVCHGLKVEVENAVDKAFVTQRDVEFLLNTRHSNPIGKKMNKISTHKLETIVEDLETVSSVECYKSTQNNIKIIIYQRVPIFRVISDNGDSFFVDENRQILKSNIQCVAYTLVTTGIISRRMATHELYDMVLEIKKDPFWEAQIQQICVNSKNKVFFIPRVGNQKVYIGGMTDIPRKLDRLKRFYNTVIKEVGWDKYVEINVAIPNQIVCTKRN
ncbi:MAG: hypothetical protein WCR36_04225 [Bacteroidaceae bacterium]